MFLTVRHRCSAAAAWKEIARSRDPRVALEMASDAWLACPRGEVEIVDEAGKAVWVRKVAQRETGAQRKEQSA